MVKLADTTAAPAMIRVGWPMWRRELLMAPLTLRDLGWYDRLGGEAGSLSGKSLLLLLWLSLRHHQPAMTFQACRRAFRFHPLSLQAAVALLPLLNPGAFTTIPEADGSGVEAKDYSGLLLKSMATAHNWDINTVLDMTLTQVDTYITPQAGERIHFDTLAQAQAYNERKRLEREGTVPSGSP